MENFDWTLSFTLLRIALGLNLLLHGLGRFISGTQAFRNILVKDFERTVLPQLVVTVFAYALPPLEVIIGMGIVVGLFTKSMLIAGFLLMIILMAGKCLQADWNVVGLQMVYLLIYFLLLALLKANVYSLDAWDCV